MGNLTQLWQLTAQSDTADAAQQRAAVRGLLGSVHTLTTGLGWQPPASVAAPATWPDNVPLTTVGAWENWYDSIAVAATLPPSRVLETITPVATGTWSANLALSRDRSAPRAVTAYMSVQGTEWETLKSAFQPHPLGTQVQNALANAERSLQTWWFTRLGGATGTLAPFPPPAAGQGNPDVPGRTPTSSSTSSGSGGLFKAAVFFGGLYALSRALRRGRR